MFVYICHLSLKSSKRKILGANFSLKYRRMNHANSTKFSLCLQMSVMANQDDKYLLKKRRFNLEIQFEESNGGIFVRGAP